MDEDESVLLKWLDATRYVGLGIEHPISRRTPISSDMNPLVHYLCVYDVDNLEMSWPRLSPASAQKVFDPAALVDAMIVPGYL